MRSWRGLARVVVCGILLGLFGSPDRVRAAESPPKNYEDAHKRAIVAWERLQDPDLKAGVREQFAPRRF